MTSDLDMWIGFYGTIKSEIVSAGAIAIWERAKLLEGPALTIIARMDSERERFIEEKRESARKAARAGNGRQYGIN